MRGEAIGHIRRSAESLLVEASAVARLVPCNLGSLQLGHCNEVTMISVESPHAASSVLVADDDEDMRSLIAETLRGDGHHVGEARDGVDLLDRLKEALDDPSRRPLVVVTDVLMPNLSGLGVLAALRRSRWQVPVILMTALDDES